MLANVRHRMKIALFVATLLFVVGVCQMSYHEFHPLGLFFTIFLLES